MFVGIDVSTTASKALVIDAAGQVVAHSSHPHKLSTPQALYSEQDAEDWWQAVCSSLRDVLQIVPASSIRAVGLAGQMHGLTSLDKDGRPVRPAMIWNDTRAYRECDWITEKLGAQVIQEHIGTFMLPSFTAPKLLWLKRNEPESYSKIAHVLLPKDYVRYRLSGERLTDVADASGYGLLDIANRAWSQMMLAAFDFPLHIFPQVCESASACGVVNEQAHRETGLAVGTLIVGGAGDQAAGGVACGIVKANIGSLCVGTSGVLIAYLDEFKPDKQGRIHCFCNAIDSKYLYMGCILSAFGSLNWFLNSIDANLTFEQIEEHVTKIVAGSEKLVFLPYLVGERNPIIDPLSKGVFFGLNTTHNKFHMIRAVMEGVGYALRHNLEVFRENGVEFEKLVVSGGVTLLPCWVQLLSDILNKPIYITNSGKDSSAFGAAVIAAVGCGHFQSFEDAVASLVKMDLLCTPNAERAAAHSRVFEIYKRLYPALKQSFAALADLDEL
jgi:xylulokinase